MAPASGTGGCLRRRPAPLAAGLFPAALDRLAGGRLFLYGGGRPGAAQSAQKTLRAVSDGSEIWRSAAGQKVQSLLWCDIDHDGAPELLLLVWRWGRFGRSRPFWKPDRTGAGRSILISTTGRERTFARHGWPRISVWMPPHGSLTNSSGLSSPNGADGKAHGTGSAGGLSELHNDIGAEQEG